MREFRNAVKAVKTHSYDCVLETVWTAIEITQRGIGAQGRKINEICSFVHFKFIEY